MKATQLEQMREDFVYIKTTKHCTEDKVEQQNEVRISHMVIINCIDTALHCNICLLSLGFLVDRICHPVIMTLVG